MARLYQKVPVPLRRRLVAAVPDRAWPAIRSVVLGQSGPQVAVVRARARLAGLGEPAATRRRLIPVRLGRRPALAHPVTGFRAGDVLADHAALVADALEAGGVDYLVLEAETGRPRVLVVADSLRPAAWAAVEGALAGTGTYVRPGPGRRARLVGGFRPGPGASLRIFRCLASPDGQPLSGPELGCELQFWPEADGSQTNASGEPIPAGSLLGDRRAAHRPDVIPAEARATVREPVDGRPRPRLAALDRPGVFSVDTPIDAVYTWVDGTDPDWLRAKAEARARLGDAPVSAYAANPSRFASRDELRYSLRSLDMYADWIRHVFLVTADQVPPWLRLDHPRLSVVSHRELFGSRGRLPTFNSHAIESQLHHIEGLAENFLYLNDDMFFGRPVSPGNFVLANGTPKFFLSGVKIPLGPPGPADLPVTHAAKNNRDLLRQRFDRLATNKLKHIPYSLRRSVLFDLEREFAEPVARTAKAQFRSPSDVSTAASLAHYYGFLTGRAVPGALDFLYVDIARAESFDRLEALLRTRRYDVFCLNDHDSAGSDPQRQAELLKRFLTRYFPLPSQFELS